MPKTKKKAPRAAPRVKRGNKVSSPTWDGWENWSGEQIHRHRDFCRNFYYENFKASDLYQAIFKWMAQSGEYTKEQIRQAKAAPNTALSVTAGCLAHTLMDGAPDYVERENEFWESLPGTQGSKRPLTTFLKERIEIAIAAGSKIVEVKQEEEKKNVYVPTIQERIRDQSYLQSEAIDEWLEGFITDPNSFDPKGFDFKGHFVKVGTTQAHARKIRSFFENELIDFKELEKMPSAAELKKMDELEADLWAQLKEGYAHIKKAHIKKYEIAINELLTALDFVIESAKATRAPRKAKPKSATKLVEKLKYSKTDDKFKLASIKPEQIIGASELWVFNTKTRKLGKYVAENPDPTGQGRAGSGLQVKGTTITGFKESESVQKTLRKPEEKLKEFKEAGKVKLRNFLSDINAVDIKLNGRINMDTILLKVS